MIQVKKSEKDVVTQDYHRALHGVYRVWVAAPQGNAARLIEYEMDQEALEEFVVDYTRFAEIIVRMEVVEEPAASQEAVVEN